MNWIEENTVKAVIPNKGGLQQMIPTSIVREKVGAELAAAKAEVERLKEEVGVYANSTVNAMDAIEELQQPDPALTEVLAKFKPPFRWDVEQETIVCADGKNIMDSLHMSCPDQFGTAIAEWLNKNVKNQSI